MDFPRIRKNIIVGFAEATNPMLVFSTKERLPVYYFLLPGNEKDIPAFIVLDINKI